MKNNIIHIVSGLLLAVTLIVTIDHYQGQQIYNKIRFGDKIVIVVDEGEYILPKNHEDYFYEYMSKYGWNYEKQAGKDYIFEKNDNKLYFSYHPYKYHVLWKVEQQILNGQKQ